MNNIQQKRYKYPRTFHFLESEGAQNDDRILPNGTSENWTHEVVITEKMDGENTSLYCDGWHVRSLDYEAHPSRNKIAAVHGRIAHLIPEGWRICCENLTAKHSIKYTELKEICEVFGIWNGETCLSWDDTETFSALLELPTVPVLWRGMWKPSLVSQFASEINPATQEGFVVRPTDSFQMKDFNHLVGKFVRKNHVQTSAHWMRSQIEYNEISY
jgi:hypothetical protein